MAEVIFLAPRNAEPKANGEDEERPAVEAADGAGVAIVVDSPGRSLAANRLRVLRPCCRAGAFADPL